MNIHEYQAKKVLAEYGVPVPPFGIASSEQEALEAVERLHLKEGIVKIQVHAGGRGKGGGVVFAKSSEEIVSTAKRLIGMKFINHQTGKGGVVAHQVLITPPVQIAKEFYLGAVMDRVAGGPIILASPEGGMDIEEIALKHPKRILKIPIQMGGRVRSYHLVRLAKFMKWEGSAKEEGIAIAKKIAKLFVEKDASLLEINPLVLDKEGKFWALDAKLAIDDNALYRQKEMESFFDPTQISHEEAVAKKYDLAYVAMDGNIGCMVNGAGLAMATMDMIEAEGGSPANFLDVGGSATKEKIAAGFKLLFLDKKVEAILVNIFGGIMNCETIAEGVLMAAEAQKIEMPIVVRMEGTHVEEGRQKLLRSGLKIVFAEGMKEAATVVIREVLRGHTH